MAHTYIAQLTEDDPLQLSSYPAGAARYRAKKKAWLSPRHMAIEIIIVYNYIECAFLGYAHACVMKGVVNLRRGLGMQSRIRQWFSVIVRSDYYVLTRFLFPLSFTVIAVDIGEQVSWSPGDILFGPCASYFWVDCLLCLCFATSPRFDIIWLRSFPHKELDIGMPQFNPPSHTISPLSF